MSFEFRVRVGDRLRLLPPGRSPTTERVDAVATYPGGVRKAFFTTVDGQMFALVGEARGRGDVDVNHVMVDGEPFYGDIARPAQRSRR